MDTVPFVALVVAVVAAAFVAGLYLEHTLGDQQPVVLSSDPAAGQPPAADLPSGGGGAGGASGGAGT